MAKFMLHLTQVITHDNEIIFKTFQKVRDKPVISLFFITTNSKEITILHLNKNQILYFKLKLFNRKKEDKLKSISSFLLTFRN